MPQPLVYIDRSDVREGALEGLKDAIAELARLVEENEPRLISYSVYFSEDGRQMTVVHVHSDSASLDHHMEVAGPRLASFAELLTLSSIHTYGEPSEQAFGQLRDKVGLLGSGDVIVHRPHAGFSRSGLPERRTLLSDDLGKCIRDTRYGHRRRRDSRRGGAPLAQGPGSTSRAGFHARQEHPRRRSMVPTPEESVRS